MKEQNNDNILYKLYFLAFLFIPKQTSNLKWEVANTKRIERQKNKQKHSLHSKQKQRKQLV